MVTQGPFKVVPVDQDSPPTDLTEALRLISFGPFRTIRDGKFYEQILGQTLLCSVDASRKFRPPTRLGGSLYEGCTVIQFEPAFTNIKESLTKSLQTNAKQIKDISGYQVMRFDEKVEDDLWQILVVVTQNNLILCATDEGFLRQTLNRMKTRSTGRALPPDIPEWGYVNTQAQCWGIRHYSKTDYSLDPSSPLSGRKRACNVPDREAVGFTYFLDPSQSNKIRIRYLSTNRDVVSLMQEYWGEPQHQLRAEVKREKEGVDISFVLNDPGDDLMILFNLLAALGQCVYV